MLGYYNENKTALRIEKIVAVQIYNAILSTFIKWALPYISSSESLKCIRVEDPIPVVSLYYIPALCRL